MSRPTTARLSNGLPAELTKAFVSLWTEYAGKPPTNARTEIRGNDAIAAVVRLTRQRVASFVSSHDRDTDVATEVFTLEPSFKRGAPPRAVGRMGDDFRLLPARM